MKSNFRLSTSELEVMAHKALEAIGVASGLDSDGAYAIVWCEVRGLEGLAMLIRDFDALVGSPSYSGEILDAGGLSALVVAPMAIDLAMVKNGVLRVYNIRSPIAALAYAVRRARNGRWFKLIWGNSRAVAAEGTAVISCLGSEIVETLAITSGKGLAPPVSLVNVTASELEKRRMRALTEGLNLNTDLYLDLLKAAKRILVPASENSRSGAGAEVDDND